MFATDVSAAVVKELRDRTGASMGKCREALKEEGGDIEKAVDWLKRRGVKSMERRTADSAESLISLGLTSSSGALVELRAETDFVTRSEPFQQFLLYLGRSFASTSPVSEPLEARLGDEAGRPRHVTAGVTVSDALLEVGSVLGEKLVLGNVHTLSAPIGGVVAGYVHPKQADGLPGTGRMAALVALCPTPSSGCDLDQLRAIADKLARHIVAAQPRFLTVASIPAETLFKEQEILKAAHLEQLGSRKAGSIDEQVLKKVIDGKTQKFHQETVLECQELVAPQATGGEAKPIPVAEWLQAEARSMGLERILVEDFKLAVL